jgi:hypothetical protein
MLRSQTLAFSPSLFQISAEVHRDVRDSDELGRQIVTTKVERNITIVGRTRRTLLDVFDLGTCLRAFAYSDLLYLLLSRRRSPGQATPEECFSDARDPRVQLPVSVVQLIYA